MQLAEVFMQGLRVAKSQPDQLQVITGHAMLIYDQDDGEGAPSGYL